MSAGEASAQTLKAKYKEMKRNSQTHLQRLSDENQHLSQALKELELQVTPPPQSPPPTSTLHPIPSL